MDTRTITRSDPRNILVGDRPAGNPTQDVGGARLRGLLRDDARKDVPVDAALELRKRACPSGE